MICPAEMAERRPMQLHGGVVSTTTDVWDMLQASHDGDLARVKALVERCPALATCQYDYTSPLHFAVREGHLEVARFLAATGGIDPHYRTHPFLESMLTVARDRGLHEIEAFLEACLADESLVREKGDTGKIDRGMDVQQQRFQDAVDRGEHATVEALLAERPSLATDPDMFWGEGVLAMPANEGDRDMMERLMRHGARVPDMSKWPKEYYFKRLDSAEFLLANGMNPNHRNWRGVTLLHDLAFEGEVDKVRLLIDYGATLDVTDDEYRSTPLGFAARWGQSEVVTLLLERGADPNAAGAPWATPLAWARAKGHTRIAAELERRLA